MDCHPNDLPPQAEGQTDVVVQASRALVGTQGQYSDQILGATRFTYTGGAFIPYDQLTQDQVLGWIWASGIDKDREAKQSWVLV